MQCSICKQNYLIVVGSKTLRQEKEFESVIKNYLINKLERTRAINQIQGDPNQNCLFQIAIGLKLLMSEPMLVKSKLV